MPLPRPLDVASSWTASVLRLGLGLRATDAGPRPAKTLELYEFEGCPFCRKAREALTMLDLRAMIYPCPKGGPRFRPQVIARGGRAQFPYLVDPNTGDELYESADIVAHLYRYYGNRGNRGKRGKRGKRGNRPAPWFLRTDASVPLGSLATLVRGARGGRYRPARAPEQPLLLYSFEASPFCRIVREALCELELPYLLVNVGKGSAERAAFRERSGRMMVPWLSDPNTGRELFESADIVRYLHETYAA